MNRRRLVGHAALIAGYLAACASYARAESTPPAAARPESTPAAAPAAAPPAVPSSIEVSAMVGPSVVFTDPANPEYARSFRRAGFFGELAVGYRSSYFIDPFISVGYATLANGVSSLPAGPWGDGGTLDQHLGAWVISPGVTTDIWCLRLRYGLGLAIVVQDFKFRGHENSSTQTPLAHQFGLGVNLLHDERFRVDAEARFIAAPGTDLTFMTFGFVARGDLISFGKR